MERALEPGIESSSHSRIMGLMSVDQNFLVSFLYFYPTSHRSRTDGCAPWPRQSPDPLWEWVQSSIPPPPAGWLAGWLTSPPGQSSGSRWWSQPRAQPSASDTMRTIRDGLCSPIFEVPSFYQSVWTLTLFQGNFYYCRYELASGRYQLLPGAKGALAGTVSWCLHFVLQQVSFQGWKYLVHGRFWKNNFFYFSVHRCSPFN